MKLHLTFDDNARLEKFLTFKHKHNRVDNLDEFIDDGEIEELVADNCLTKFTLEEFDAIVDNWTRKLCVGGILSIWDIDIKILSKLFIKDILNLIDYNKFFVVNKSGITILELEKMLRLKGFKILEKQFYNHCGFKIKAEKLGT